VLDRRLKPDKSPILTWAFGNLEVDTDPAQNRKFSKKRALDRIDPMIALAMSLSVAYKDKPPIYDFSDIVIPV
jgi:phage terminase large subunit-like protein